MNLREQIEKALDFSDDMKLNDDELIQLINIIIVRTRPPFVPMPFPVTIGGGSIGGGTVINAPNTIIDPNNGKWTMTGMNTAIDNDNTYKQFKTWSSNDPNGLNPIK
jgi:hypothetical protein